MPPTLTVVPNLYERLWDLLGQVPPDRVTTCGGLAEALGNRIAARWIGHLMLHHEHAADCPCHRVIRAGGLLGGYITGAPAEKAERLRRDGVEIHDGLVDLSRFGFEAFQSDRPLERLRAVQEELVAKVSLRASRKLPTLVGGVDVSYPNANEGVAAHALVDVDTGELVRTVTVRRPVRFPYITSYLSFRELPLLVDLLEVAGREGPLGDVILVDGSGILHQRHAGIATHLGVAAGLATIGVTKKLLCGAVDIADMEPEESRPVVHEDRTIGLALRPTAGSRRPIFVSPGHRVDLARAEWVVRRMLRGRRLPEPIYWADKISRAEARC